MILRPGNKFSAPENTVEDADDLLASRKPPPLLESTSLPWARYREFLMAESLRTRVNKYGPPSAHFRLTFCSLETRYFLTDRWRHMRSRRRLFTHNVLIHPKAILTLQSTPYMCSIIAGTRGSRQSPSVRPYISEAQSSSCLSQMISFTRSHLLQSRLYRPLSAGRMEEMILGKRWNYQKGASTSYIHY